MIAGKTKTGFKFEIDERIASDWRIVNAIAEADSTDFNTKVRGTATLVKLILGKNEEALINHLSKKNDGFVPVEALTKELYDIISSTNNVKN